MSSIGEDISVDEGTVSETSNSTGHTLKSDVGEEVIGQLLWKLDTSSLLNLKQFFHKLDTDSSDVPPIDSQRHRERRTLYIAKKDFENAIKSVFGHSDFTAEASKLFRALDSESTGFIWWEQLLDRLLECGEKRTSRYPEGWTPVKKDKIKIQDLTHCKKESIVFVVPIETETSFCFVIVSKYGKVGVYDGKMKLLMEYDVFFTRTGVSRRVRDVWITAAINLEDSQSLLLAASDRSLMIYDSSTLLHVPTFLITGITNIPTCLAYNSSKDKTGRSCLVMGDDHGGMTLINFKQPRVGLFLKQVQDKINNYFWIDLQCILQEPYCEIKIHRRLHARPVKKVVFLSLNDSIISCSSDPEASLIIRHRKGIRDSYIFKVNKGVSSFQYSITLKLLVTGSSDGRVRIWNPVIPAKPTATLALQSSAIMDIVILAHMSAVLSFNKNGELKVIDILSQTYMQSIQIRFSSFGILGRLIQFGPSSIYFGPARRKGPTGSLAPDPASGRRKMSMAFSRKSESESLRRSRVSDYGGILRYNSLPEEESLQSAFEREIADEIMIEASHWNRPEVLVTCCNHIAVVPLSDTPSSMQDYKEVDGKRSPRGLLPPPDKTNRPRKPSIWDDDQFHVETTRIRRTKESMTHPKAEISRKIKKKINARIPDTNHLSSPELGEEEEEIVKYRPIVDTDDLSLDELLKRAGLTGIFEKDFINKFGLKHDMNSRLAQQKPKQEKMKLQVSQGAPYSALELQDPQEIRFSAPLPISLRMQRKSGLDSFSEPQQILRHNSCFSMVTPRSTYSSSPRTTGNSKKSDGPIR